MAKSVSHEALEMKKINGVGENVRSDGSHCVEEDRDHKRGDILTALQWKRRKKRKREERKREERNAHEKKASEISELPRDSES